MRAQAPHVIFLPLLSLILSISSSSLSQKSRGSKKKKTQEELEGPIFLEGLESLKILGLILEEARALIQELRSYLSPSFHSSTSLDLVSFGFPRTQGMVYTCKFIL